ncbi:MAG: amidohydrolase family protein [Gammaproteobacteria bacterium]|nr:amidohydrolase family protein [Gammaproteobacteria bacterium]
MQNNTYRRLFATPPSPAPGSDPASGDGQVFREVVQTNNHYSKQATMTFHIRKRATTPSSQGLFYSLMILPILSFMLALSLPVSAETLVLSSARLLDVTTGRMSLDARVVVVNGKITSVNPTSVPADARSIDLGDRTLMPGLIDSHVHLTSSGGNFREQILTENAAEAALRGARSARVTLMAGFTTVRDLAQLIPSPTLIAVALADASKKGWIAAPRIITAGHALSITGGQIDPSMWVGTAEGILELGPEYGIADGLDEVVKATRYQIKYGAKVIKITATAGIMSQQDTIGVQQYYARGGRRSSPPRNSRCCSRNGGGRNQRGDSCRCRLDRTRLDARR